MKRIGLKYGQTRLDRKRSFAAANRALSTAQDHLADMIYHGAAEEIPTDYEFANSMFDTIEQMRRDIARHTR